MTDHIEDDVDDTEYDETVGLDENDLRVTHRAAFMTLMQAWDARLTAEENGQPADILAFRAEMETAFQRYKESMATLTMLES